MDMKNRCVNFSSNRKHHGHHSNQNTIPVEKRLNKSNKSLPFSMSRVGPEQRHMVSEVSANPEGDPAKMNN